MHSHSKTEDSGDHCSGCTCYHGSEPSHKFSANSGKKFMNQNAGCPKGAHGRGRWNRLRRNSNGKRSDSSDPPPSRGSSVNSSKEDEKKKEGEASRPWVPKFRANQTKFENARRGKFNNNWRGNRQRSPSPKSSSSKGRSFDNNVKKIDSGPIVDPKSPEYANASCCGLSPHRQALMKQSICFAFYENGGRCDKGMQCPYTHKRYENGELVSYDHLKVGVNGTRKNFVKLETKETYAPGSQNVICHSYRIKQWCAHGDKCWNKHLTPKEIEEMTKKQLEELKKVDEQFQEAKARGDTINAARSTDAAATADTLLTVGVAPVTDAPIAGPSHTAGPSSVDEKQTKATDQSKPTFRRRRPAHKLTNWRFKEDSKVEDNNDESDQSRKSSTDETDSSSSNGGGVPLGRTVTKPHIVQFNLTIGRR